MPAIRHDPKADIQLIRGILRAGYEDGFPVLKELLQNSDEVVVVTSGDFTREARSFAQGKPIQLLDGPQLLALVQSVQIDRVRADSPSSPAGPHPQETPTCPHCGKPMVQRTARRGANAGNRFWGCSAYPACKGIVDFTNPNAS